MKGWLTHAKVEMAAFAGWPLDFLRTFLQTKQAFACREYTSRDLAD